MPPHHQFAAIREHDDDGPILQCLAVPPGDDLFDALAPEMVNTGVFGTCFMLLFLIVGSVVAMKVIFHLREHGVGDDFSRVSCIVACLWMANTVAFLALHGDSEYAMKTFSLQAGLLIVCQYMLRDRLREEQPELE